MPNVGATPVFSPLPAWRYTEAAHRQAPFLPVPKAKSPTTGARRVGTTTGDTMTALPAAMFTRIVSGKATPLGGRPATTIGGTKAREVFLAGCRTTRIASACGGAAAAGAANASSWLLARPTRGEIPSGRPGTSLWTPRRVPVAAEPHVVAA